MAGRLPPKIVFSIGIFFFNKGSTEVLENIQKVVLEGKTQILKDLTLT